MKCEFCNKSETVVAYLSGCITEKEYLRLCSKCERIFLDIPDHIPNEQCKKYYKLKYEM